MRYGARLTHRWKGRLLTALAATVLLVASAGTAAAQNTGITVTGPSRGMVNEGGTATYTVTVRGYVGAALDDDDSGVIEAGERVNPAAITVELTAPTDGGGTANAATGVTTGELLDLNQNLWNLSVSFDPPENRSPVRRLFTQTKTITLPTLHDNDAEDENFTLVFPAVGPVTDGFYIAATGNDTDTQVSLASADAPTSLTIDDDETQNYTLTLSPPSQKPTEGNPFTVDLKASPAHVQGTGTLNVVLDKESGWTYTVAGGGTPATTTTVTGTELTRVITITQTLGDRNRVTDTVTVSAHTGTVGASREVASLSIDVADAHALQAVTAKVVDADGRVMDPQPTSVEEGASVKIAVMPIDDDGDVTTANENLTIALASSGSADATDFRLSERITITAGQNSSNVVDLIAETDEDVGMEMLVLDATVSGVSRNGTETKTVAGVLSLTIMDATEKKIWPKDSDADYDNIKAAIAAGAGDEGLNPGETVEIMTSDLFGLAEGYTASYGVSVEGDAAGASASGSAVMITAMQAGEAKITVTGTARHAGSSLEASQTVSNVAELTFPVTVVDKDLVLTWYVGQGGDDYNIENLVEGQSYEIIVNANRAITEAEGSVEVTFMRDRAASDADDSDYTVGTATIRAGRDHAHARPPLMVLADDISEGATDDGGNVGEQLVLFGVASNGATVMPDPEHFSTDNGALTIWDTAVPALPVIATWLLGLGLLGGGARQMYLRRRQD